MADSPSEANLDLVHQDSDLGEVDEALDELRRRLAASQERVADLEGELKDATDEEAETAQRLDQERQRRVALVQQLDEVRKEATRLILHELSREAGAGPSRDVDDAAGTTIASEETAALISERDRLAGEVAELTNALAAAQAARAELSKTVASFGRERDEIRAQSEQAPADQGDTARMSDEQDEAGRSIETPPKEVEAAEQDEFESRDEDLPDDEAKRPTRYERASAKLPSIGDDASEVIGSLEDLRKSLRRR